jgi:metal-dependent amidase/aminoacylase/carboxypeptidase family protein
MKPTWRAHGVFTDGGTVPAIIPETSQLHYFFRCPTLKDLKVLVEKADHCFRGAAEATGE